MRGFCLTMLRILLLLLVLPLCSPALAPAQPVSVSDPVPVPAMRALVTDLTGTLSAEQQEQIETRLRQFSARKGSQIAVLIVPTTGAEPIDAYGLRVVEQWKLGRKDADDGALLLVARNDRAMRIEVGYGLEGALPDLMAQRILAEIIEPRFEAGDYFGGIDAGTAQIERVIDGEPLPPAVSSDAEGPDWGRWWLPFGLGALALGGLLKSWLGRWRGATVAAALGGTLAWFVSGALAIAATCALAAFAVTLFGNGLSSVLYALGGRRNTGSGGSGGFGGGVGGGGGRFGGGGASGKW